MTIQIPGIQSERIEAAMREILAALGEDTDREGIVGTPARVAEMYQELFAGLQQNPSDVLATGFEEDHDEMVVVKDIQFFSMCEHHFLPFYGLAYVGYIPRGRVVGLSKLVRALEILARRPQLQERLTTQYAEAIMESLDPWGVGVVIEAEHLCMAMRGVNKPGTKVSTSATRGTFRSQAMTRSEFLSLLGR
ncbi:MAG: GTP cyclohydrolase I [Chloroflexi bacterium]|jgi:GTP cyclohydrolase I|nr:MAG: GTP cyclohydrolase I [Chloroflexota bacterium]